MKTAEHTFRHPLCPECVLGDEDPRAWCDCRPHQGEDPCRTVACQQRAHDPAECPTLHVYVDGARDAQGYGGWAFVHVDYRTGETFSCVGAEAETTNNRMELKAAISALGWSKGGLEKYPLRIVTDSAYVSNCFLERWYIKWRQNGWINSKRQPVENADLWRELLELVESRRTPVFWSHVRGHNKRLTDHEADRIGNELADSEAVDARIRFKAASGAEKGRSKDLAPESPAEAPTDAWRTDEDGLDVMPDPDVTGVVNCDQNCGAPNDPGTAKELRAAYEHWRFHGFLGACSHGH